MVYIATVVFESGNEEAALLAFQNAACLINEAKDVRPLKIAHIQVVLGSDERPVLETKQVLRPEDFSTWREGKEGFEPEYSR